MNLCDKLRGWLDSFRKWVKPPEIEMPECVKQLLIKIYPNVDWSKVHFHNGLPWFLFASPATDAITLPDIWGISGIHIYLKNYDPCNCSGLQTIVHECFHVQQYTDIGKYGVGYLRLFMIDYFSCWIANGFSYDAHPMEIAAYAFDRKFFECCAGLQICDCKTKPPTFNQSALNDLIKKCPDLVVKDSGFTYNCGWISVFPAIILDLIIAATLVGVDVIFFGIIAILAIATAIGCSLQFIWNLILLVLSKLCNWSIQWKKKCTEWAKQAKQKCIKYRDDGYNACNKWADQGYNACTQWADQGYNACTQWADQGYSACCTWAPCSWFCKVLVWISNIVCVVSVWVSNMVCLAWVWVSKWVCLAWIWISSVVCIAWVTIVKWICVSFTWVIAKITCW